MRVVIAPDSFKGSLSALDAAQALVQHARRLGVPVTLVSGSIEAEASARLSEQFDGCSSLTSTSVSVDRALRDAARLLAECAEAAARSRQPE